MSVEKGRQNDIPRRHPLMRVIVPDTLILGDGTEIKPAALEKALRKEGRLYESPCIEVIKLFFLHFTRPTDRRNWEGEVNLASHLSECKKRTCLFGLQDKMYIWTFYDNPTKKDLRELRNQVKEYFGWDRAEEVIAAETEHWLDQQEREFPDKSELIKILRRPFNRGIGCVGAFANLKLQLSVYERLWDLNGDFVYEPTDSGLRSYFDDDTVRLIFDHRQRFQVYRDGLQAEAARFFDQIVKKI